MTPQTGQHVKCILRNGAIAEGIVEEWFANTVQLRSVDGESILIITHPSEDIMLIKIILEKKEEETLVSELEEQQVVLEKKFEEQREVTDPNNSDSIKTLAELRIEMAKQERRIIAEKLREHRPGGTKPTVQNYTYPGAVSSPDARRNQDGHPGPNKKPSTK